MYFAKLQECLEMLFMSKEHDKVESEDKEQQLVLVNGAVSHGKGC